MGRKDVFSPPHEDTTAQTVLIFLEDQARALNASKELGTAASLGIVMKRIRTGQLSTLDQIRSYFRQPHLPLEAKKIIGRLPQWLKEQRQPAGAQIKNRPSAKEKRNHSAENSPDADDVRAATEYLEGKLQEARKHNSKLKVEAALDSAITLIHDGAFKTIAEIQAYLKQREHPHQVRAIMEGFVGWRVHKGHGYNPKRK